MSVFSPVKAIIYSHLATMPSELKKATIKVLDELDGDLDKGGYIPSSTAEEAFEKFNDVLKGLDQVGEEDTIELISGVDEEEVDPLFSEDVEEDDDDDEDEDGSSSPDDDEENG